MTWKTTKELYAEFLGSDFWVCLSRQKRKQVGKCERCGSKHRLQSHHVRYPENWFDTRLEDLEVLCRKCHARHHGKSTRKTKRAERSKKIRSPWKTVCHLRSHKLIDRDKFEEMRRAVGMDPGHVAQRKKERNERRYQGWHPGMYEGLTPVQVFHQVGRYR